MAAPTAFPAAFVWTISDHLAANLTEDSGEDITVVRRPIRPTDPNFTIAVMSDEWTSEAYQIGSNHPLIAQYEMTVWALSKYAKEDEGAIAHAVLARNVRRMLAESTGLMQLLGASTDTYGTNTERVQRVRIGRQRFHANELNSKFLFLSVTSLTVETENI